MPAARNLSATVTLASRMGEPEIFIRLFGSPQVTVAGQAVKVDTRKAIAMLALLAIEGSADRDVLANLFWADSPPDRSRATLRRTLSALRSGVGAGVIEADRNRIHLVDGHVSDVARFRSSLAETTGHDHDAKDVCRSCIEPLQRASTLYQDDFLGSFAIKGAPEFEDWVRSVAEGLRLEAGDALRRLSYALASDGDYPSAITAAMRWVGLDEIHEPAHRLLMLLNAWAGDRPGAIRAYRDCVAVLDRELGVSPLEETTELFEAIMDEDLPPAPGTPRPVRTHQAPPTPRQSEMIDRVEAIATLQDAIDRSRNSSLVCFVSGASWMGKTRLLEHATDLARSAGHEVVASVAFRAEVDLPFAVALQILEGLTSRDRFLADLPDWAVEELTRLLPRLSAGGPLVETSQLGPLRLRDAFLTLVELHAAGSPTVVIVDDAQWIDSASAEMLAYLQRRVTLLPLLIVISARDPGSLHPTLRDLVADAEVTIRLDPLVVDDLTSKFPDADLATTIDATGGIPLLVHEALTTGEVGPDSSSVIEYIDSRRRRLSDLPAQILAAAAVLSGMCDTGLLKETSGRTEEEVVEAVEELVTSGLLREQDDDRLGFTLDLLERVTYESTSPIRRRLLHRRAAEALEARSRSRMDARVATATAGHLRLAGREEAAEWYRLAGELARNVHAVEEARTSYETALALGHPDVGEIRLALGEMAITVGDYEAAQRELQAAAARSEGEGLSLVEHRLGGLDRVLGRFDLAEESFVRAEPGHPRKSDLYADWALLRYRVGDQAGAADLATKAVAEATTNLDTARALNVLGVVTSDPDQALGHIEKALESAGPTDLARVGALNNKAHLIASSGDYDGAISLVEEAADIAPRTGYRHHQAALLDHLADLHHRAGRRTEAEKALTEAVTIFADIHSGDWEPELWLLRQW